MHCPQPVWRAISVFLKFPPSTAGAELSEYVLLEQDLRSEACGHARISKRVTTKRQARCLSLSYQVCNIHQLGNLAAVNRVPSVLQLFLSFCVLSSFTAVYQITRKSAEFFPQQTSEAGQVIQSRHKNAQPMADNAMHMSMQMTFEASTSVTLWLKQWHNHSWTSYVFSCAGLVALCLIHEALSTYRRQFHEDFVGGPKGSQYERFSPQTPRSDSLNETAAAAVDSPKQ